MQSKLMARSLLSLINLFIRKLRVLSRRTMTRDGCSCQRPAVLVGGELTAEMLDLQFNAVSKDYVAPAQLKANNGVLIIDDFGRQRIRPDELLNRLDRSPGP